MRTEVSDRKAGTGCTQADLWAYSPQLVQGFDALVVTVVVLSGCKSGGEQR
jgi:hypothetical protein